MKQYKNDQMSRKEYIDMIISGDVNPDPIGQRPAVPGMKKSREIVEASMQGFCMGMIILRDIRNDEEAKRIYPGVKYLVIDGGHRSRAYKGFYQNKFLALNSKFNELDEREQDHWLSQMETLCIYECTSLDATKIFRNINKTTAVNNIEMLMAHEVSPFAKVVRSQTKKYYEYSSEGQNCHKLFNLKLNSSNESVPACFQNSSINPRRKWDEWVAFAFGMIVNSGVINYTILNDLTDDQTFIPSKNQLKKLKDFLDTAYECTPQGGFNDQKLASFLMVYFQLGGKIVDRKRFKSALWKAHQQVVGNSSNVVTEEDKKAYRTMLNNYFDSEGMRAVAKAIIDRMDISQGMINTAPRTISRKDKIEMLELQGGVCAIDGDPLDLDEAEYGHDTAYAKGGSEGVIIRRCHNREMGQMSLSEYKDIRGFTSH